MWGFGSGKWRIGDFCCYIIFWKMFLQDLWKTMWQFFEFLWKLFANFFFLFLKFRTTFQILFFFTNRFKNFYSDPLRIAFGPPLAPEIPFGTSFWIPFKHSSNFLRSLSEFLRTLFGPLSDPLRITLLDFFGICFRTHFEPLEQSGNQRTESTPNRTLIVNLTSNCQ